MKLVPFSLGLPNAAVHSPGYQYGCSTAGNDVLSSLALPIFARQTHPYHKEGLFQTYIIKNTIFLPIPIL